MSTTAERFRPGDRTLSTRLMMAGAFLGALVVLGTSVLFSWPVQVQSGAGAGEDEASNAAAAFDAPPGSCLTWQPDGSAMRRVSCDEPHLFEVTGDVDIAAEHGSAAPSPTEDAWREIARQRCTDGAVQYLGGKLDPFGKYSVGALKPSDEQWRAGDRKLRCGLQRAGPSGKVLVPTTGPAAKQDQSDVYDPGTCLALNEKTVGDPIDCSRQHAYEIVGIVDLGKTFPDSVPSEEQQQTALLEQCTKVAAEYSGNADLAALKLILTWDTRKAESWQAGSRLTQCKVGATLPDNSGLAPVTNSIKGVGGAATTSPSQAPSTPGR